MASLTYQSAALPVKSDLSAASSTRQWRRFLDRCLSRRIDVNEFRDLAKLMINRYSLSERKVIDIVLESRSVTNVSWDPLIPLYVDALHLLGKAKIPDILTSLLAHSTISEDRRRGPGSEDASIKKRKMKSGVDTFMTDFRIIQNIAIAVTSGYPPKTTADALNTFVAVSNWISALVSWNSGSEGENNQSGWLMSSPDALAAFESLGILLAALAGTEKALNALSLPGAEGICCSFYLASFNRPEPLETLC
jgi:mediator of RNA polymerase II transcription subunit 5